MTRRPPAPRQNRMTPDQALSKSISYTKGPQKRDTKWEMAGPSSSRRRRQRHTRTYLMCMVGGYRATPRGRAIRETSACVSQKSRAARRAAPGGQAAAVQGKLRAAPRRARAHRERGHCCMQRAAAARRWRSGGSCSGLDDHDRHAGGHRGAVLHQDLDHLAADLGLW